MHVVIMAAGLGKRMKSKLPKVLHRVCGEPILFHILDRVRSVKPDAQVAIVVGHGRELVESSIRGESRFSTLRLEFILQPEQRGTGDAVRCVAESAWGQQHMKGQSPVLVLPGDCPLFTDELIHELMQPLGRASMRLLTTELKDPTGYGRVVRRGKKVLRIVEEKDASARERQIREVGVSIYAFQGGFLRAGVQRLSNKNAQSEFYLTDLVSQAAQQRKQIDVLGWENADDLRGINNPWELALANQIMNRRLIKRAAMEGVRFVDPSNAYLEANVEVEGDVEVGPGVVLQGRTRVMAGATIGSACVLRNTIVEAGAILKTGTVCEESVIRSGATVGPYAHFRPGSEVGANSKIGNFVELKNSKIGESTSVAHLSYLGDATVGKRVNVGCGFVTCNFDGRVINGQRKHATVIEDDAFIGSDCQAVAPVKIGIGAYVASGSTITENVEAGSLAIARSRQVNKKDYAKKLKGGGS